MRYILAVITKEKPTRAKLEIELEPFLEDCDGYNSYWTPEQREAWERRGECKFDYYRILSNGGGKILNPDDFELPFAVLTSNGTWLEEISVIDFYNKSIDYTATEEKWKEEFNLILSLEKGHYLTLVECHI